jgi:transcriptional regulator with GAF, ATPase, and Fis domain
VPAHSTEKQTAPGGADCAPILGLTVVYSPDGGLAGTHHRVERALLLGRLGGSDLDLALDDGKMSRRHARVARSGDALVVEDLGSTNGTSVDGARISRRTVVHIGGVLRAGNSLFVVEGGEGEPIDDDALAGRSPVFAAAVRELDRVAPSDLPVLLLGETGTGKEVFAARLHRRSGRRGRLVPVNCAAIPRDLAEAALFGHRKGAFTGAERDAPGHFAEAHGGTLFLDEIGELPVELQAKLLRAVETREVAQLGAGLDGARALDVRLVCATNADLAAAVEAGAFRRDLYARIAGFTITLPPLRDRRADIVVLAERFVAGKARLSAEFLEPLLVWPWPMNVRELRAAVLRALLGAEGTTLGAAQARAALGTAPRDRSPRPPPPPDEPPGRPDEPPPRDEVETLLASARGNVAQVAAHYGKDRKQVYRWLRRWGIDPDGYRS